MKDCATCRFFEPKEAGIGRTSGECRRHAPVVTPFTDYDGRGDAVHMPTTSWPQVGGAQWCGDFQEAPEFEEVAPLVRAFKCDHCEDGNVLPPDETPEMTCPKCGASTLPF